MTKRVGLTLLDTRRITTPSRRSRRLCGDRTRGSAKHTAVLVRIINRIVIASRDLSRTPKEPRAQRGRLASRRDDATAYKSTLVRGMTCARLGRQCSSLTQCERLCSIKTNAQNADDDASGTRQLAITGASRRRRHRSASISRRLDATSARRRARRRSRTRASMYILNIVVESSPRDLYLFSPSRRSAHRPLTRSS